MLERYTARDYKLLIFDWDGTLIDSVARIVACFDRAIADLGLDVRTAQQVQNVIGLGLREAILGLYPEFDDDDITQLVVAYRKHYFSGEIPQSQLFPGVQAFLRSLHGSGYLLAVATGKGRRGLQKAMMDTGCDDFFHATRTAEETCSKPDPKMLYELLDELNIAPAQALMIGDSAYDMEMARRAEVAALAVEWGVHERERLMAHSPIACVSAMEQMAQWLLTEA